MSIINSLEKRYRFIYIAGFVILIITAFFSEGYHHPDEHFQILEFCNYKLGNASATQLPWEFESQSRQALPVYLAFVIINGLKVIGINDPFIWALVLRLLTACVAWMVFVKLSQLLLSSFKTETGKYLFVACTMFLWFVPYQSVRFSSENLAAITFLIAVYIALKHNETDAKHAPLIFLLAGLILGFSFYFRFQIAFAIIGLLVWIVFKTKKSLPKILLIFAGGLVAILLSVVIDYWFYGSWIFTPFIYFQTQILKGVASNFGVSPWWNYFLMVFLQMIPPLSLVLLAFFFNGLYKHRNNVFVWIIIPFLIAHFAVGHKEMRFLFPMTFAFIYLVANGIDDVLFLGTSKKLLRISLVICLIVNIPLLIARMFIPAQEAIAYYKFVYHYQPKEQVTIVVIGKNFYQQVGLQITYYKPYNVHEVILNDSAALVEYVNANQPNEVLLLERSSDSAHQVSGYRNELAYCFYPDWLLKYNPGNWQSRAKIWSIRRLVKN